MPDTLFRCSVCNQSLSVSHQTTGQFIDCPKCKSIIEIPPTSAAASPECPMLPPSAMTAQNIEAPQPKPIEKKLKKCPQCAETIQREARICKHCKTNFIKNGTTRKLIIIGCSIFFIGLFFVASTHIIIGERIGFMIVTRTNPGFGEFIINMDEILYMPKMFAVTKYPIGCKVLQREGLIESDKEFRERVKIETQNEIEENRQRIERERLEMEYQRNEERHRKEMEKLDKYLNRK